MKEKVKKIERKNVISVRLTDEEFLPLKRIIDTIEISKSDFFRLLILNRVNELPVTKVRKPAELKKLIFYFNKASNNLNQLTKRINIDYQSEILSEQIYLRYLNSLINIRDTFVQGIDKC
ncbi:plasmid mobilization protein [Arsenophonus sp.]|uniref:plasmid mobilization protein n=1 Tax=Arsenophonus sp. TaxID=1872640 RepID=UPI00285B664E|nr:relaxosome protein [Arsenophonus sp.]MDR5614934.1 relaxosome protein [Arsenophonus sp.]